MQAGRATAANIRAMCRLVATLTSLLLLLLAACGGGGGGDDSADGRRDSAANGENGDGEPGGTGNEAAGTLNRQPGPAPLTDGDAAEGQPEREDIPAEGRYTYRLTSPESDNVIERFLDVHDTRLPDGRPDRFGSVRQVFTWSIGDDATRQVVAWLGEGLFVEVEQRARGSEAAPLCDWGPDYLQYPLPLEEGASWEVETACEAAGGRTERTITSRATDSGTVRVDGRSIPVLVVERTETTTRFVLDENLGAIELAGESFETTDRFAPDRGLLLRSEGTRRSTVQGVPHSESEFSMEIVSMVPGAIPYTAPTGP